MKYLGVIVSFDTMHQNRFDKHALGKCENIYERPWYDAMQNIFLIVFCKLIGMYMVIGTDDSNVTVNITESTENNFMYYNSFNNTTAEDTTVSTNNT